MRTAVLVSGSRKLTTKRAIWNRLKRYPAGTILIHGGAAGADTIAGLCAKHLGFLEHVFPYFGDLGKRGGRVRNECMFNALLNAQAHGYDAYFEAFPIDGPGTAHMISIVDGHLEDPDVPRIGYCLTVVT
jgi:hypothetical protein